MAVTNHEVIQAWMRGEQAKNHKHTLSTTGKKLFSYSLQIGDTTEDGRKVVAD